MADQDKLMIRKFLKEISDNIPDSELANLVFVCNVDKADEEKIKKAFHVFDILEKRGELSIDNFTRLKEVLVQIKRIDLKNRVEEFERKIASTGRIVLHSKAKRDFNRQFLQDLGREVGTNWRMIARRLGVTDTEIDEIENDYRKLAEQSYQSLRKWVEKNKGYDKANPNDLKQALLDYNLRRIAEDFFDII